MFEYPGFRPRLFLPLAPIAVRWYGLMYVLAFLFAWWLRAPAMHDGAFARRCQTGRRPAVQRHAGRHHVGGRVGYCLVYGWEYLIQDPLYLFKITEGGMSFHGGLAGVMIAMWWFGRSRGKTMWQILDFVAPIVPLGLGFRPHR